ncbi:MAG: (Fe-S)-binding protein, partial [Candidatus Saliniplasma sp.]
IHMCLSCGCCEEWCPFDFSVSDILRPEKEKAIEEGVVYDEFEELFENLEEFGNIHGEIGKERSYPEDGDVLYLRGCEYRESDPEVIDRTMDIFDNIDIKAFVLSEENCCGIPAYNTGNTRLFEDLARDMAEKINGSGADKVVTSCPSCAYAYRKLYSEYGQDIEADVLHIVEYLEEKKDSIDLKSEKEVFTYHEPCKLINGLGRENSMKNVLEKTGIDTKAPRRNGKKTFCCGYGGTTVGRLNEDLASNINKERLDELKELSNKIITSCPTCKKAFEDNDEDVNVYDIAEIFEKLL